MRDDLPFMLGVHQHLDDWAIPEETIMTIIDRANTEADALVRVARTNLAEDSRKVAVQQLVGPASGAVSRVAGGITDREVQAACALIAVLAARVAELESRQ